MNYETKVKEILMDCYITGMDEKATQAILSLIREAKIEELEVVSVLFNDPNESDPENMLEFGQEALTDRITELKAEAEL